MAAMQTADLAALKTAQIASLTTANLVALGTAQVAALTTAQVGALTTSQMAAFTTAQFQFLNLSTPIILDLNGDGVKTLSISSGVKFDMFADGQNVNTGWVSKGDGLLVLDRNQDGTINDGSELFGSSTTLASGLKAADGYVALRELDSNSDGSISSEDAAFGDLRIWVDSNSDGLSGAGEVKTLASLGITQISLQTSAELGIDNGNLVGLTSTYKTADGLTHAAADVWFATNSTNNTTSSTSGSVPIHATEKANLTSVVSGLAQAIGSFSESSAAQSGPTTGSILGVSAVTASQTAVSLTVGSMVDVMKQFDVNGNRTANPGAIAATLSKSVTLPGIQEASSSGFLTMANK